MIQQQSKIQILIKTIIKTQPKTIKENNYKLKENNR